MAEERPTHRPDAESERPVKSAHPVVHRFEIEKETRTWILVLVGVLGLGGAGAAGAAIQGSSKNNVDPVEKKQLETLIENNDRKRRECDQKRHEWQKKQDKLFRATIRKLGGGIQGPSYPDVEFHPPPAPGSDAPKWQTTETLLEPPSCE